MSSPGALVVITCNETETHIDPSRYFNLNAPGTQVFKTPGGRTSTAISNIYYADQANRIGMIIVVQHTNCSSSTGPPESNIRDDIKALKDSPYVRNDIPIIGYVLNTETGQLREVNNAARLACGGGEATETFAYTKVTEQLGKHGV